MDFAQNLARIKKEKGLTNIKIAEYAGVSESAVRTWLGGAKIPNINAVTHLCEKLNMDYHELLGATYFDISDEHEELVKLWDALDPFKQAEVIGYMKGLLAK